MINKISKRIKKKNILFILPLLLLFCLLSTFSLVSVILKIDNIENILRYMACLFLVVLLLYIFFKGIVFMLKGTVFGVILYSLLLIALFSLESFSYNTINKVYGKIDNISKDSTVYSTSLISLKESKINDISKIKNYKIGIIDDKNSIDGYIIADEIIKENNLKANNEIIEYETFASMLSELYDKKIDLIFISSNYPTMFANIDKDNNKYSNIKNETLVLKTKTKTVKKQNVNSNKKVEEPFTLLLMGVDSTFEDINSGSAFNGDALMLITFNPSTFNATILSIPRDTYVPIMCFKNQIENKITHAAWYGESCMVDTIENFTGMDIDYHVKINFKGVVKLVDALGGVNVDVPYDFCEQNSNREWGNNTVYVTKGYHTINGEQALALSRNRHTNPGLCAAKWNNYDSNDIQRGLNQQLVINGIINKIKEIKNLDGVYKLLDVIEKNMDTSLTTNQILSFYDVAKSMLLHNQGNSNNLVQFDHLYLDGYDKYIWDAGMGLTLYNYYYNRQSLKDIVTAMKINLQLEQPTLIKTFDFSINENYEAKLIGKGPYNYEPGISTLPSFVNSNKSVALNWGVNNNIPIHIKSVIVNKSEQDGRVLKQSIPYGYIIKNINKQTGITIDVGEYNEEVVSTEIDCSKEENSNNSECLIPDFKDYTISMATNWKNSLKTSIIVTIEKIDPLDVLYNAEMAGKLRSQSVVPNTSISKVKEIILTFYEELKQE